MKKSNDNRPLATLKLSQVSAPTVPEKTADPKFIIVLFCVEAGAFVFNIFHVSAPEIHLYNAYNQNPIEYNVSSVMHWCFTKVNYCVYEHEHLRFLKAIHLVFIIIILICYFSLFIIIHFRWENSRVQLRFGITWYGSIQLAVLLTLALHILIMVILYQRDHLNIYKCNKESRLVRGENLFTYVVLSLLEVCYIGFDILNRQASIHAVHQVLEQRAREADCHNSSHDYNINNYFNRRSNNVSLRSLNDDGDDFVSATIEL